MVSIVVNLKNFNMKDAFSIFNLIIGMSILGFLIILEIFTFKRNLKLYFLFKDIYIKDPPSYAFTRETLLKGDEY